MKKYKIQKEYIDYGCGFPIKLINVPMIYVRDIWTPNIKYNTYMEAVSKILAEKLSRLTGNELHFIRGYFEMTLQMFAKRFSVSHVAVLKWEKMENKPTSMNWATEKDIRLFILSKIGSRSKEFVTLYEALEEEKNSATKTIELDAQELAA